MKFHREEGGIEERGGGDDDQVRESGTTGKVSKGSRSCMFPYLSVDVMQSLREGGEEGRERRESGGQAQACRRLETCVSNRKDNQHNASKTAIRERDSERKTRRGHTRVIRG